MSYYIRLDDACEKMDVKNWARMEEILDRYHIAPLVGIIPHCEDPKMEQYPVDPTFWETVSGWVQKGWVLGLHGYNHVYITEEGGLNPVQKRSEFAGVPLDEQKKKIADGVKVFRGHGYEPTVFFAPSHTFDRNTLTALRECSQIRVISDTVANKPYTKYGFTFIPQQSGIARKLPFDTVTVCLHPNLMGDEDFAGLEAFLAENPDLFEDFRIVRTDRKPGLYDFLLQKLFFLRKSMVNRKVRLSERDQHV